MRSSECASFFGKNVQLIAQPAGPQVLAKAVLSCINSSVKKCDDLNLETQTSRELRSLAGDPVIEPDPNLVDIPNPIELSNDSAASFRVDGKPNDDKLRFKSKHSLPQLELPSTAGCQPTRFQFDPKVASPPLLERSTSAKELGETHENLTRRPQEGEQIPTSKGGKSGLSLLLVDDNVS
jgi:hypothetical protein